MNNPKEILNRPETYDALSAVILQLAHELEDHIGAVTEPPFPISIAHSRGGLSALEVLCGRLFGGTPAGWPGDEYKTDSKLGDEIC